MGGGTGNTLSIWNRLQGGFFAEELAEMDFLGRGMSKGAEIGGHIGGSMI